MASTIECPVRGWCGALLAGWLALLAACAGPSSRGAPRDEPARAGPGPHVVQTEVCVYGATSAGVTAAIAAARAGCRVVLIDCDGHVGGLSSAGLGATDVGNKRAIGGLAREFYRRLRAHYDDPTNWTRQRREDFAGRGHDANDDCAWTFEPHVASAVFAAMLREARIVPIRDRLDREADHASAPGASAGHVLQTIHTEGGRAISARVFLDCSYEGDLLAAAGCDFVVGREANARYGETLNGVQVGNATKHQFDRPVDPYVRPGDPDSGLLPGLDPAPGVEDGHRDHRVQAYCFRICATDDPDNRIPWPKPAGYDERDHELLLRWYDAGSTFHPWSRVDMPNRKTDSNNNGAVSTDWIGANWDYPAAGYAERERIVAAHRRYQQGLMWTLANHPRVPARVREAFGRWGLCKDEFAASDHWPPLLYIREARRLVGDFVVTEHHCMGRETAPDPVGMGAYAMDSHNVRRHVVDGAVRNEGDVQVRVPQPYGISYRALVPARADCVNLLVPVCVSASHIAFGSIRMEPVFMVLGESAGIAAAMVVQGRAAAVQDVDYAALRERLLAAGQVLEWR